ncbi:beta-lactamase-like protein [Sphaerosporella brunnea]|uniref:Beta-lactamase-like protein n=1 Tax=Sphaerosporella brunnea TaxID=1250544 RepID=A0A5J5EQ78_9PEZI|nr:beta-lactamase-like protein [Sphaerosporella brunnea]
MSTESPSDLLKCFICTTCGTQFGRHQDPQSQPFGCRICADPRQYVPSGGINYTSLNDLRSNGKYQPIEHKNEITLLDPKNPNIYTIVTTPKFAIGQRCFFIKTPGGNVLWDLITFLDEATERWIREQGGLHAIVISHPHYYTTHRYWSGVFNNCPVYLSVEDREWLSFPEEGGNYQWILTPTQQILPGVTAIKVGGHFPGSLCLLHDKRLFIADSLVTVPSAHGPFGDEPPKGVTSYSFMWSIPNMIPMPPQDVASIVKALEPWEFDSTHGAFNGMDVVRRDVKKRVLESARIALAAMGYRVEEWLL